AVFAGEAEGGRGWVGFVLDKRHGLEERWLAGIVGGYWSKARLRELGGDPFGGCVVTELQRHAALETIAGDEREIGPEIALANGIEAGLQARRYGCLPDKGR